MKTRSFLLTFLLIASSHLPLYCAPAKTNPKEVKPTRKKEFFIEEEKLTPTLKAMQCKCDAPIDVLKDLPYFTGPLITPSPHVIPFGHINIEPYIFANYQYGLYNSDHKLISDVNDFTLSFQMPVQIGFAPRMDLLINPSFQSQWNNSAHSTRFGDLQLGLEIQLVYDTILNNLPGIKLMFVETFPTGKYDRLNPFNEGTDASGDGSYRSLIMLVFTRMWNFPNCHFLSIRSAVGYTIFTPVNVKSFNSYGGGFGTDARVYPGNHIDWLSSFEYNFNLHWGMACDLVFNYGNKTTFKGDPGIKRDGDVADLSSGSFYSWSLAPAIEYNYNEHIGLIVGPWFTFSGRNAPAFITGVAALNLYY